MATAPLVVPSNKLLAHMSPAEAQRFESRCEPIDLEFGAQLASRGERLTHVYFPTDSFISLITTIDGDGVEVGLAGDEGMMGVSLALGVGSTNLRAMVQGGGPALRMSAEVFVRELARSPALRETVGRYTAVVMNQQSAYAYDPADACQGPNPESQCSTVSGGHAYMTGYSECVWSSYAEGPVWRSDFECRLGDDVYSTGNCFEYFPSGNPQYCG
jgi:hypothetical protein